ncbi:MAG: DUF177 domain-containing protein [Rubrimonas sp.]|uniref:YceD family protein n=1 Tax=Rubrimonas sp. TaxID=2036015 RepID=UPI002FDC8962
MFTPPPPEFSRPIPVERLRADGGASLSEQASAEECAALARRFNVPALLTLGVEATVEPMAPGGWRLRGTVAATLRQICVITLESIETSLSEPFERRYLPEARIAELDEDEADDVTEPLGEAIDVGEAAAETAALAIDPYPRKPGAVFEGRRHGPAGTEPLDDEAARPFARLAALRPRPQRD